MKKLLFILAITFYGCSSDETTEETTQEKSNCGKIEVIGYNDAGAKYLQVNGVRSYVKAEGTKNIQIGDYYCPEE